MDHNEETKVDNNSIQEEEEVAAKNVQAALENRGVSWADGTDSTEETSRRHAKEDDDHPLNPKFSEEGSTVAAVMDDIIVSSSSHNTTITCTASSGNTTGSSSVNNSKTQVRTPNCHSDNNLTSTTTNNNTNPPPPPPQPPQVVHDATTSTINRTTMAPNELSVAVIMPEEEDNNNSRVRVVQSPPADVARALLIGSGSKEDSCASFVTDDEDDEDDNHHELEEEQNNNNAGADDVELAPTFSSCSTDSTTTPSAPHEQPPQPVFVSPCRTISSDEDEYDDESTAAEDAAAMFYAPPSFGMSHSSDDEEDSLAAGGAAAFEAAASQGIILPPSLRLLHRTTNIVTPTAAETAATTAANTAPATTTTRVHHSGSAEAAYQLLSLPIDSLHCVASFLTPLEWAQYGQTCTAANKVGREIFRRVRMHGFKCATEVVTAWKLDQHADAKELAALYISAGVPIYPYSLGHSYHTICWRMGIEAKQMQQQRAAAAAANPSTANANTNTNTNATTNTNNNNEGDEDQTAANVVDRFHHDRTLRARDANNPLCSYLEEKAMFTLGPNHHLHPQNPQNSPSPLSGRWNSMTSLQGAAQRAAAADPNMAALPPPQGAAGAAAAAQQLPDFRPPALVPPSPLSMASAASSFSSPPRSMSQTELVAISKAPKVPVPVHRHLLDQHLLGRSSVDDEEGTMTTPPVNLAADFFHPHLSAHCMSGHSRPLLMQHQHQHTPTMQVPSTPPRLVGPAMAASSATSTTTAAAATTTTSNEDILRDPAFQEWAARAVANTNNRFSVLDDVEELRELHEVYSQIFDQERMGQAAAPQGNATAAATYLAPADQSAFSILAPPQLIARAVSSPQQNSLAEVSLEESLLSTVLPRQGYSSILNSVDLEVYSASKANLKENETGIADMKRQMRSRFTFYHRRLEVLLMHGDSSGYEECMLDFWDEFFPLTAKIHYYDRHTPVPRISSLQQFLTQPCPKEIGIVQCEIERVKTTSRKRKGVSMKGRLFPTYEYRLFIKDREHGKISSSASSDEEEEDNGIRRDTVLMVAKNRGRKHVDTSGVVSLTPAAKKGANNYYLYTPQQTDVDTHFNSVNEADEEVTGNHNGVSLSGPTAPTNTNPVLLGRLQSNFIGTEFQIYTPKLRKNLPKPIRRCASLNDGASSYDDDADYDDGAASDTGTSSRPRRSRFGRLTLRRNSSHAATPTNSSDQSLSMTRKSRSGRSRQETAGLRGSRTNRRAIANSTEAPENVNRSPINEEPFLYEEEDGVITYTANLLGSRPRIMDVCVPKIAPDGGSESIWRNYLENSEDGDDVAPYNRMLNCFKQLQQRLDTQNANDNDADGQNDNNGGQTDFGLLALQNRPPWWNVELGSFVLNFRGRVSVASVKNFQLCDRNDHDHIMLQFGRIAGRHSFTMDYQYPLTAVQAFSIAISSLQSKISFG